MKLMIDISEESVKKISQIKFLLGGKEDRNLQLDVINAINNGIPLEDELEKIKADIKDVSKTLVFINHTTMVCDEDTKLFVSMEDMEKMFVKHISELKGENK